MVGVKEHRLILNVTRKQCLSTGVWQSDLVLSPAFLEEQAHYWLLNITSEHHAGIDQSCGFAAYHKRHQAAWGDDGDDVPPVIMAVALFLSIRLRTAEPAVFDGHNS